MSHKEGAETKLRKVTSNQYIKLVREFGSLGSRVVCTTWQLWIKLWDDGGVNNAIYYFDLSSKMMEGSMVQARCFDLISKMMEGQ